jgi:hypothetical protein
MAEDNRILRLIYTFFLGLLLAIFVGVGINTFYPGPEAPEYPVTLNSYGKEMTKEQEQLQRKFDLKQEAYNEKMKPYNRNVSIMVLFAAVLAMIISFVYEKKIRIIADGVMLGGLFMLLYSLGRGFASEDTKYVFAMVSAGLVIVLYLGYHRFIRPYNQLPTAATETSAPSRKKSSAKNKK